MTLTSMIIPTYNGLDLIRPCIDAIRQYSAILRHMKLSW